jgi:hypothetical protein
MTLTVGFPIGNLAVSLEAAPKQRPAWSIRRKSGEILAEGLVGPGGMSAAQMTSAAGHMFAFEQMIGVGGTCGLDLLRVAMGMALSGGGLADQFPWLEPLAKVIGLPVAPDLEGVQAAVLAVEEAALSGDQVGLDLALQRLRMSLRLVALAHVREREVAA